ncbi:hypothetical protein V6N13_053570 [Hibiscus sabdariffa]
MASFNVFFVLYLHALLLVLITATHSVHPLALPHKAVEDEVKKWSPLNKFSSLPHFSMQLTKVASITSATVKNNKSKEFSNGKNKSALIHEGREAIKASMKRNTGNPLGLKRLNPGGLDPHHHSS